MNVPREEVPIVVTREQLYVDTQTHKKNRQRCQQCSGCIHRSHFGNKSFNITYSFIDRHKICVVASVILVGGVLFVALVTEKMSRYFLDPRDCLARGLRFLQIDHEGKMTKKTRTEKFRKHYGSSPLDIATQWYDLCHTDLKKAKLTKKEKTRGFKMFMAAHFFLWTYSKNSEILASRFGICERLARGAHLWDWIERIAALEQRVIFWPKDLDSADTEINALSVDGTDKKGWERKHETLPYDPGNFTQKHAHGGLKFQVTLCAQRALCVDIFGPVRGGMGDKEMLERSGILKRLKKGKLVIADRGYIKDKWKDQISWPHEHDSKKANNFKSRVRLRHESFNGRMCYFGTMNQTWHHTDEQLGFAFRAVAVNVQYQMNNGSPLFVP